MPITTATSPDPIDLDELGATVDRKEHSTSTSLDLAGVPIEMSRRTTMTSTWSLPHPSTVKARFAPETTARKLFKWVRAELQTGHVDFDDAVYISTSTDQATRDLLESPQVRHAILTLIEHGGDVRIDGARLVIRTYDRSVPEPPTPSAEATLVAALVT